MSFAEVLYRDLKLPVIVAPMFLISGPDLVIAAGRAGLIGAFPAPNARTIDDLKSWLLRISHELAAANRANMWAINMIVHSSYDRFAAELALVQTYQPRLVITALGNPKPVLQPVHDYGGAVFCDVITPEQARKAADAGVDGIILVASGAGGHTGKYSPFAFVDEVRRFWDGPLVLGGAIGNARAIRAALTLGADFAYMGTRFIACPETLVSDPNREMLVRAEMRDIVTTAAVSGVPANWMRESLELAGFTDATLKAEAKIDFANLHGESKAWKTIWGAGQAVGQTRSIQSVAQIVNELVADYAQLNNNSHAISAWPR
jgi:nitronate monooxygenase